jgi:hypothetical protein
VTMVLLWLFIESTAIDMRILAILSFSAYGFFYTHLYVILDERRNVKHVVVVNKFQTPH